jgi:hypothetical protein
MLLISNSIVSRAIWKNLHSWVFQRLQIALILRTGAILIVFEKLTPACFFQIALSKLHCLRYRTKENNRSNSTQNIFIHSQTYITQTPIQQQNQRKHSKKHCGNNGKSDYKWVSEQIGRDNQPYIAANKFPM